MGRETLNYDRIQGPMGQADNTWRERERERVEEEEMAGNRKGRV